ncbi:MAG: dTMP kinase [Deltaproteobacteria bacterium]|nr:dTMP kinase [Deltaproteobacteria bacterium]
MIAFEGTEGTGKSTHLSLVAGALRHQGYAVCETREPGGTAMGAEIRRLVMHLDSAAPTALAELLLYLADRAQHIAEVIRPALAAGQVVLTDRFSASTIAYQAYGRGLDLATVSQLDALVCSGLTADLTVLLDCPVAIGLQRARGDDRFHRAETAFHERVRQGFLIQAAEHPDRYCLIDATRAREQVTAQVLAAVRAALPPP